MKKAYHGFLNSHLLWKGDHFGMCQFELPKLTVELTNLPHVPIDRRLGHQAEFVFLQFLNSSPAFEVIAHSIQLIDNKRTLGELDYIIRNKATNEILHIELTYKFYILDPSQPEGVDQLVGPNRKDTFVKKLNKTKNKQLPLLFSDSSRAILKDLGLTIDEIGQRVAFYGHVFLPVGMDSIDIDGLSEDCVAGNWLSSDAFEAEIGQQYLYYLPFKYEWLHIPHENQLWMNHHEIITKIANTISEGRSVMLWKKKIGKEETEIERFFVLG